MCSGSRRKHSSREVGLEIIKGLLSISHHQGLTGRGF